MSQKREAQVQNIDAQLQLKLPSNTTKLLWSTDVQMSQNNIAIRNALPKHESLQKLGLVIEKNDMAFVCDVLASLPSTCSNFRLTVLDDVQKCILQGCTEYCPLQSTTLQ